MFSTLEYQRNEFHKTMQKRDEIRKNLEENSLNNIKALHEKNNVLFSKRRQSICGTIAILSTRLSTLCLMIPIVRL